MFENSFQQFFTTWLYFNSILVLALIFRPNTRSRYSKNYGKWNDALFTGFFLQLFLVLIQTKFLVMDF
jgi:hypothetical protein